MSVAWSVLAATVVWVLLWGSASVANVLSGLAIGVLLVIVLPRPPRQPATPIRPVAVARLAAHVAWSAVRSNVMITRAILSRRSELHTTVVDVPLPVSSDELLTAVANLLAITPGTMPLDVHEDPRGLYVHILHRGTLDEAKQDIRTMTDLCVRAFGSDDAIRGLEGDA